MSTRRQTDWGRGEVRGDNPLLGSSPSGASEELHGVLQAFVKSPGFGKLVVPGKAGDLSGGTQGGIDMNRLNRSILGPLYGQTSGSYSISSVNPVWAEVDSFRLAGNMVCTGRPVRVDIASGLNRGTSTGIIVSASMDGNELTRVFDGLMWNYTPEDEFHTGWRVFAPPAGIHRFALVASVASAGTATMYCGADDIVQMCVTEL